MVAPPRGPAEDVARDLAAYTGFSYGVGGGAAFFLGVLTAGLYPGLAVITRMRRHRADESRLYFRIVDRLRERLGRAGELDRLEALADGMRRQAARGVAALLVALGISLTLLAAGPVLAITYHTYRHDDEVVAACWVLGGIVGALIVAWMGLALFSLGAHRRRAEAVLDQVNALTRSQGAPPVRTFPAGMHAGQVFWLVLTVLMGAGLGLLLAGFIALTYRGIDGDEIAPLLMGAAPLVLGLYVAVSMVWSNHARRWDRTVMQGLAATVWALEQGGPARARPLAEASKVCGQASCGAINRPVARYCRRCGQPL